MVNKRPHSRLILVLAIAGLLGAGIVMTEEPLTGAAVAATSATSASPAAAANAPKTARAARLGLRRARRARLRATNGVEFGIYPGGGAGAVNRRGEPRPEVAELRQQALDGLRGSRAFAVHLYDAYTGPADAAAVPTWLADQIASYSASGLRIELVLRYRPASGADVPGFAAFVRSRVAQLGPNRQVVSLQITNEANVAGAPDAADGAYRDAAGALVAGTIAAKAEASRLGHEQLAIGFNVADDSVSASLPFFSRLKALGGRRFTRAVDWVGVDAYPGTWGPALPSGAALDPAVRAATRGTVDRLRTSLLPAAGLRRTPIVFAESGYPTDDADRTEADQVTAMRAAVETVVELRRSRGVIGYRWFDLRDADSGVASFESQYGLLRDDYSPKVGFDAYRSLVARYG